MSGNLDHIDLNADVVSVEPENDVHGVNVSESTVPVGPSDAGVVTDSVNGQGETREPLVDKVRDFEGVNGSEEVVIDGFSSGDHDIERKIKSVDRRIDLEEEIRSVDRGDDAETGVTDVCMREVDEATEEHSGKIEENHLCRVQEEVLEGSDAVNSRFDFGDAIQVENEGASDVGAGIVYVEVNVANGNDIWPQKVPGVVSAQLTSDDLDSHAVEIDEQATTFEGQTRGNNVPAAGISEEIDNLVLSPDVSTDGNDAVAASKPEFNVSDLVWGKVRSHPWWPGQIFDLSDASKKAKKYFKRDSYLIAYFGDQTFAWNEESKIKPFRPYFSQLEKQSSLEDFHYAVHCALDEVSRRVEFGLACTCIPEYANIKTQVIVNAGVGEDSSRRDGGDSFSSAASFEPFKLVQYMKALGQSPFGGLDRLEFVTAQAQLLAFNRWKGYSHLPEFQILGALLDSDAEIPLKPDSQVNENAGTRVKGCEHESSGKGKSKGQDYSSRKRKRKSGDNSSSGKKEKSLAELLSERCLSLPNYKSGLGSKKGKLIPSFSGMKRKVVDSISDDLVVKRSKRLSSSSSCDKNSVSSHGDKNCVSSGGDKNSSHPKRTFRVGDSILRVASQLTGPTQILKSINLTSQKTAVKSSKSKDKSLSAESKGEKLFPSEDSSTDEIVSQLLLVARDPMKECSFIKSIVGFFVEFRNSICLEQISTPQHQQSSLDNVSDSNVGEESVKSETETSEFEQMKDSYLTDTMIQSFPEELSSLHNHDEAREHIAETPTKEDITYIEPQSTVQLGPNLDYEQQTASGAFDLETVKPADCLEENYNYDPCPTALILNFTDLDSVPSEANLNKIFSRFGHLKESETEVFKKSSRAKVVFFRRADAEAAFSSAGKYSIFGPSLVSYSLKYMVSTPSKSSPNATKRSRKDMTPMKGYAT